MLGGVDHMVDHLNVSYLYKKRGVFYFSKRVPCDVKSYYRSDSIVICLKTKSSDLHYTQIETNDF